VSVYKRLSELRETINVNNKEVGSLLTKYKVVLIGDSNFRGYVYKLKHLLKKNYELYSVIKRGATMNELKETTREEIGRLSHNDVILISYGINDYEAHNFSQTLQNIADFVQRNNQTNIILMNLPYRYDLSNSNAVNRKITILNRKLKKFIKSSHIHTLQKQIILEYYLLIIDYT
jgi:lysophospholipase L1-like esterase